jgi:hypothetical protein
MKQSFKGKNTKDVEFSLETVIPDLNVKSNRNKTSPKCISNSSSHQLEEGSIDDVSEKRK